MNSSRRKHHRNSGLPYSCGVPGIPLYFQWKLRKKHYLGNSNNSPVNFGHGFPKRELSARKLAAGLWRLQLMKVSGDGGAASGDGSFHSSMSGEREVNGNERIMFPPYHNCGKKIEETKDLPRRPVTILRSRNGIRCELESSLPCLEYSKEEAAKGDPTLFEASNEFIKIHSRKLLEDRKLSESIVPALLAEILRAQRSINKLKAARGSSKKKVEQLLQKLEEEKVLWKRKEHQKIQAMLDDLKDKLARERRSRERMELLNTKLAHELAEANLSVKQFMTNYEEEKKRREVIEEVCNELALQIAEDKAKFEVLLRDSMKVREEVEEERKMWQMCEQWREERVQMKLVDAKLALEEKYNQMIQLIAYLQTCLRSRGAELGAMEGDTQLIKQAAELLNIQGVVELLYDFSKSNDIFSIYEEFRNDNSNERVINPDSLHSLTGHLSTIHIVSLDEEELNKNSELHQSSPSRDCNTGSNVTNSSETVGHVEDQNFSPPSTRRDTYLDNLSEDKMMLGGEAECSEKAHLESPKTRINGVCSVSAGKSKWKAASASRILRSSLSDGKTRSVAKTCQHKRPGDGRHKHKDSVALQNPTDLSSDECSTGSIQSGGITCASQSQHKGLDEGDFRHRESWGKRNSTNTMNPHITRAMKGCIEWPRGIPKTTSKVIPLEERVRSQKSQLQHILRPKA